MSEEFDYSDVADIRSRLANEIDTSWHGSWHWKTDENGYPTLAGWEQALVEAERNAKSAREDADRRESFLPEIRKAIAHIKWLERDGELHCRIFECIAAEKK